jgi:ketosteroid isomerase-like protein
VSTRKRVVEKYIDGFRRSDHAQILSCLTDDVVWALHGYKTLKGKDAFDAEIENDAFEGSPILTIDRLIEEGDSVACTGGGSVSERGADPREFVFCEVFGFSGDTVSRLDTYHVWLG